MDRPRSRRGPHHPPAGELSREEIERRYRLVRALKAAAGGRRLSDQELDLVLAPIECRRSPIRRAPR